MNGDATTPDQVRRMAARARAETDAQRETAATRIVIAVIGHDRPGIMAGVTAVLAARTANILDVSQTILSDLFTMVMLVDLRTSNVPFAALRKELEAHGRAQNLVILAQHEEIFRAMHRV